MDALDALVHGTLIRLPVRRATLVVILVADPLAGLFADQTSVRHSISAALRIIAIGIPVAGIAPLVSGYFSQSAAPVRPI